MSLDPADRAGELPGQQFDDDPASKFPGSLGDPGVVVGQNLIQRLGGHQIADLLDEVAVEAEQPWDEVRDVAADERFHVGVVGHDPLQ